MSLTELDKRQNNMVVSVRCDRRTLATLLNYFTKHGEEIFTISSLVNLTLENFRGLVLSQDKSCNVFSIHDATDILKKFSRTRLNPGGKFERAYTKQMQLEGNIISKYEVGSETTRSKTLEDREVEGMKEEIMRIGPEIAQKAREAEDKKQIEEQKDQLSKSPTNIASKYEGGNAPIIHSKEED